jgi:hypothetical protein
MRRAGSRDQKKNMEERDVPNARDEIRKLQEALKRNSEDLGSADEVIVKGRASEGNRIKPVRNPDEQPADNSAAQTNRQKREEN